MAALLPLRLSPPPWGSLGSQNIPEPASHALRSLPWLLPPLLEGLLWPPVLRLAASGQFWYLLVACGPLPHCGQGLGECPHEGAEEVWLRVTLAGTRRCQHALAQDGGPEGSFPVSSAGKTALSSDTSCEWGAVL